MGKLLLSNKPTKKMKLFAGLIAAAFAQTDSGVTCPEGWAAGTDEATANDCFPEGVTVVCGANSITITADVNSVYFDGVAELSETQKERATVVAVNEDDDCDYTWTYDSETGNFEISHSLTECGTEASHDAEEGLLVFTNEYTGTEAALSVDSIITTKVLSFSAQCSYPDTATVTADGIDVTMGENIAEAVEGESTFEFSLLTYTADDELITAENKAEIGDQIKLSVTPDADLPSNVQFQLTGCTAGDSIEEEEFPEEARTYDILNAGSCVSELLDASFDGSAQSTTEVSLLFNSFTFEAEDDQIALKCSIKLCLTTDDTCNQAAQEFSTEYDCPEKYERDEWWVDTFLVEPEN